MQDSLHLHLVPRQKKLVHNHFYGLGQYHLEQRVKVTTKYDDGC